jgi:benzoyl-CoA reductase/2-hydroxyglutaryl-CoA dehydratase subunit BcrC/BadD/HgdB
MEELIKNVKTSTMFTDIEHLIEDMIEIISKIRQNREANSSSVKEQKRIIENDIQELRTKINKTWSVIGWLPSSGLVYLFF